MKIKDETSFWAMGARRADGCLIWSGTKIPPSGYGYVHWRGWPGRAHRIAWELANGTDAPPRSSGLVVLHSCDEPSCFEPTHLSLGTQRDNMRQREERGRGRHMPRTKLFLSDVEYIRKAAAAGSKQRDLARMFKVTQACISQVVNGKTWT